MPAGPPCWYTSAGDDDAVGGLKLRAVQQRAAHGQHDRRPARQRAEFKRFGQLRRADSFKPWLLAIVRRCHLMRLRSARRRPVMVDAASAPGSDDASGTAERDVRAALAKLPEAQRQLLMLVYMEGLASHEAAQVLGISPAAVRQRLVRARRAFRRHLETDQAIAPDGLPGSARR